MTYKRKRPAANTVLLAARHLGIYEDEKLAKVMGCSVDTVRRYRQYDELARIQFELQRSWLLVDTAKLVRAGLPPGGNAADWLNSYNEEIGIVPSNLLMEEGGLDRLNTWLSTPRHGSAPPLPLSAAAVGVDTKEQGAGSVKLGEGWLKLAAGGVAVAGTAVLSALLWVVHSRK